MRRSDRFGSKADSQIPENCRKAEFGAEEASVSVCFRPIADIPSNIHRVFEKPQK